jgi:hypothetical protein
MQTNPLSDGSSRKKKERRPKVSFARDIRPLFRTVDISHMKAHGIKLDDYTFMSDPDNADKVLGTLSSHDGNPPPRHLVDPIGLPTSSPCSPSGRRTDTGRKPDRGY